MPDVSITELRQNLPTFIKQVRKGQELRVTFRDRVVARIVPDRDDREAARAFPASLRGRCRIGEIIGPSGDAWDAERVPA